MLLSQTNHRLIPFLRSLQDELGGHFQMQEDKQKLGVGDYFKRRASYLSELDDTELQGKQVWFSNRLYASTDITRRTAELAIKSVRFLRIDMEYPDHSACTDAEAREVLDYGKSSNARGGIRTPRGVHLYYVLDRGIEVPNTGWNPLKVVVSWLMKGYTGPLKPDSPSWHRSNISRVVETMDFVNEGAIVAMPTGIDLSEPKAQAVAQRRGSVKVKAQAGGSESEKHQLCSDILSARVQGMSSGVAATALGCSIAEVENIWQKYPQMTFKKERVHHPDWLPIAQTKYTGWSSSKRRRLQGPLRHANDRWWAYEDWYEHHSKNRALKSFLKSNIHQMPQFMQIIDQVKTNYQLTEEAVAKFINDDIDAHDEAYPTEREIAEVSYARIQEVELAVRLMQRESWKCADVVAAVNGLSRQVARRALAANPLFELVGERGGARWQWKGLKVGDKLPEAKPIESIQRKLDSRTPKPTTAVTSSVPAEIEKKMDEEISEMIRTIKIKLYVGPGGSGKSTKMQADLESTEKSHSVMAPTNDIAIGLSKKLGFAVRTIHTAMSIPVTWSDWDFGAKKCKARIYVCDEFSLVGKTLFYQMLKRMQPARMVRRAKKDGGPYEECSELWILGDPNQMPPFSGEGGVGDYPLRDLIGLAESGTHPNITLEFVGKKNHRVASESPGLLQANVDVLAGKVPVPGEGFEMIELESGEHMMEYAADMLKELNKDVLLEGDEWRGISVLKGKEFGAQRIADEVVGRDYFMPGDEVVVNVTDRFRKLLKGSKGKITRANSYGKFRVECDYYTRKGVDTVHAWMSPDEIVRPHARNVHSMQGSEGNNWLMVLEYSRISTIEAFYTILSRAKKKAKLLYVKGTIEKVLRQRAPYEPSAWYYLLLFTPSTEQTSTQVEQQKQLVTVSA